MNNENEKNRHVMLGIIVALLVVLAGIGIGYGAYKLNSNEEIDNIDNTSNETINNENNEQEKANQKIEELKDDGYTEVNIITKDLNKDVMEFNSEANVTLNNKDSYVLDETDSGQLKINMENNKLYFELGINKEEVLITNIKNVYIQTLECASDKNLYILTNDGIVYYLNYNIGEVKSLSELSSSFKKVESKYKYEKLYIWNMDVATCDYYYSFLGEDSNGNKYILTKDIPFSNIKTNYEKYIITKDNYLYDRDFNVSNSKVLKVMDKYDGDLRKIVIVFEDNTTIEFNTLL